MSINSTIVELIQPISDNLLWMMIKQIKPLIQKQNYYYTIDVDETKDPREYSFLWDAKPIGLPMSFNPLNQKEIITFHTYGAPIFFKPSLAEVMSAINLFIPNWSNIRYFYLHSENMGREHIIGNCHWCLCSLMGEPIDQSKITGE